MYQTLNSGITIPGYGLSKQLLKHAMGSTSAYDIPLPPVEVWTAHSSRDNTSVVLKFCRREVAFHLPQLQYVQREGHILKHIIHPRIPRMLGCVNTADIIGFAMSYVHGVTVGAWMRTVEERNQYKDRPEAYFDDVMAIGGQTATTLGFVHSLGLVHGDIKPANLMVTHTGEVHVIDFGIAHAWREEGDKLFSDDEMATFFDGPVGTVSYVAPEVLVNCPATPASDIYMLGIVLYELLCGKVPFRATPTTSMTTYFAASLNPTPILEHRPDVPQAFARLVMDCIAHNPADRPANGQILAGALRQIR